MAPHPRVSHLPESLGHGCGILRVSCQQSGGRSHTHRCAVVSARAAAARAQGEGRGRGRLLRTLRDGHSLARAWARQAGARAHREDAKPALRLKKKEADKVGQGFGQTFEAWRLDYTSEIVAQKSENFMKK